MLISGLVVADVLTHQTGIQHWNFWLRYSVVFVVMMAVMWEVAKPSARAADVVGAGVAAASATEQPKTFGA